MGQKDHPIDRIFKRNLEGYDGAGNAPGWDKMQSVVAAAMLTKVSQSGGVSQGAATSEASVGSGVSNALLWAIGSVVSVGLIGMALYFNHSANETTGGSGQGQELALSMDDSSRIRIVDSPRNGRVWFDHGSGQFSYDPRPDFFGVDSFSYERQVMEGKWSNKAVVRLEIEPEINLNPAFSFQLREGMNVKFTNRSRIESNDPTISAPEWYRWDFGDGRQSQSSSPEHLFQSEGQYKVCLTMGLRNRTESFCMDIKVLPPDPREQAADLDAKGRSNQNLQIEVDKKKGGQP